ncbi:MAG: hypothetical protein ACREGE_01295 [Candidatus Microsaccharimonas sp.]
MSDTLEYNSGMSHAIWHTFQPSTTLEEYTGQLLATGEQTTFRFRSTKEVSIDSIAYQHRVYKDVMDAIEGQNRRETMPFGIARVAVRLLRVRSMAAQGDIHRHQVLRIAAMPTHPVRFNSLVGMLDELPDNQTRRMRQPAQHYMVTDFQESAFKAGGITEADLAGFREGAGEYVQKGLFNAALVGLGGAERADLHKKTDPDWLILA